MKRPRSGPLFFLSLLLFVSFLEMLTRFHAARADFFAFAGRHSCPLEIGIFAELAARIELSRADLGGITARDERAFFADGANFHNAVMLTY